MKPFSYWKSRKYFILLKIFFNFLPHHGTCRISASWSMDRAEPSAEQLDEGRAWPCRGDLQGSHGLRLHTGRKEYSQWYESCIFVKRQEIWKKERWPWVGALFWNRPFLFRKTCPTLGKSGFRGDLTIGKLAKSRFFCLKSTWSCGNNCIFVENFPRLWTNLNSMT